MGSRTRRARWLVAAAGAMVVGGMLVPGTANAEPPTPTDGTKVTLSGATSGVRAPVSSDLRSTALPNGRTSASKAELASWGGDPRVARYWTTARMKSAISLDTPRSAAVVKTTVDELDQATPKLTTISSPVAAKRTGATPRTAPPVTNFSVTNGKVFFKNQTNGKNYICSASSVNTGSKRVVITAGHCVHGGPGGTWHANWSFVPGYNRGSRPRGTFQAYKLRTYNDWITYGESGRGFNSDVGFATTFTNASGQRVVDAVGGHGTQYGGSRVFDVDIFGYPGNLDSGEVMWACWGTTGTRSIGGYSFPTLSGCNFGGGASGGPWLAGYSNSSGLGYVRSVTSHGPRDSTAYIDGPYFDSRFPGLLSAANGDW